MFKSLFFAKMACIDNMDTRVRMGLDFLFIFFTEWLYMLHVMSAIIAVTLTFCSLVMKSKKRENLIIY